MATTIKATVEYEFYDNTGGQSITQVCQDCTLCQFLFSGAGGNEGYSTEYLAYVHQVEGGLCDVARDFSVNYDAFSTAGNRFQILCNDVVLWETSCITGSGSANMTIPAGTIKFVARVYGACNDESGDAWSFSGGCV